MVKETHSILFANWINYYDYENIFYRSKQERIVEQYDDAIIESEYLYTIYYDENGKKIKEIDKSENEVIEEKSENLYDDNNNQIENKTVFKNETKNEIISEILYKKIIDDKTIIVITNEGAVLAQRSIIEIKKTNDGGKTWKNQLESYDRFIQIHNGAQFVFLDENIGFINDPRACWNRWRKSRTISYS